TRTSSAGARCSARPRTTRRSRPARRCGSSLPASASSGSAPRSRCSTTRSTRSAIRPCGRSGGVVKGTGKPQPAVVTEPEPTRPPGLTESQASGSILEVRDLSVEYLLEGGSVLAVDNVSFSLAPGEFVGVVGESGCGKSTMLFAIAQLLSPPAEITSGTVM